MVSQVLPSLPSGADLNWELLSQQLGPTPQATESQGQRPLCLSLGSDLVLTSTLGSEVAPEAAKGSPGCETRQDQRRMARDLDRQEPFPRRVLWTYPNLNFQRKSHILKQQTVPKKKGGEPISKVESKKFKTKVHTDIELATTKNSDGAGLSNEKAI